MDTQTPSTSSDMPHLNADFDPDMDKFLDLGQNAVNSSSTSPDMRSKSPAGHSSGGSSFGGSQPQQTFSGPSFQYDSYKQQTGLPVGGLANTFALNQATGMQYNGYGNGFIMPMETLNIPLTNMDEFDFAAYPSMDMDLEADSPTDNMFYSSASSAKAGYIDPNALLGQDNASSSSSAPVQRMYPGMHSQLAAQAKAQQAQKQSVAGQQPKQMPQGQRPLSQSSKTQHAKDPHVEESISRLLNQMRQSSVASVDDDCPTPTANLPHLARLKKDEDEMDEDERLLASEEGKKLSSKERRQLRNKVSARAFRSRRKEYIGQLEGEVAMKAQEANDLKVQNRQLMEENTRLTDLTRMLLSSQAFSGFLSELSGTAPPSSSSNPSQGQSRPQPQPSQKDVNPHQIGMATISDIPLDFSLADNTSTASSWNTGITLSNFPVYSLTSLPEGPVLDIGKLSGKADDDRPLQALESVKRDMPTIEYATSLYGGKDVAPPSYPTHSLRDVVSDRTAFELYAEPPSNRSKATHTVPCVAHHMISATRADSHLDDLIGGVDTETATTSRLVLMCSRLDVISARIAAVTSHLT
ncbi:hypothetical protein GJ744_007477 [Endocarpon pusillum]|uniref:BZIP domain-containing protein n=1 Tax=Endocarpon pusillum TaxID=364733 RepID=A0A8H7AMT6_9EURO|nr:hypothetical protein GJ744_007477 [Endocarpon pusillum]